MDKQQMCQVLKGRLESQASELELLKLMQLQKQLPMKVLRAEEGIYERRKKIYLNNCG